MSVRRCIAIACACALATMPASCEPDEPTTRAFRIERQDQTIGGPTANARIGDFVLDNGEIMAVIEGGRSSRLFLDAGGTLIDADLVRPDRRFRAGRGLDQLGQIAPTANLFMAQAVEEQQVRVTRSAAGAEVTSAAEAGPLQAVLTVIGLLVRRDFISSEYDHGEFRLYNEYEVRPGERLIRITTTVGFDVPFCPVTAADGCNEECDDAFYDDDCSCPALPASCTPVPTETVDSAPLSERPTPGLLDALLGDLPRPLGAGSCRMDDECDTAAGETCVDLTTSLGGVSRVCRRPDEQSAGLLLGDMLLLGGNLSIFLPGPGFDAASDFDRLFTSGVDTLGGPLPFDAVIGVGRDVSYGYAAPRGDVLVPVFGGSFSMGAIAQAACTRDDGGCFAEKLVRFERYVSVGEGDPASAREPIDRVLGRSVGTIVGNVIQLPSGEPASRVQVYALHDPRDLPCEGECATRCGAAPASDDAIRALSVEGLIDANRCRTVAPTFLIGLAGVENAALTDLGTTPRHEGRFRMTVSPGRYVLVAVDGDRSTSGLVPIQVDDGRTTRASLALSKWGRVSYSIVDQDGAPSAGRFIVGRCFPEGPCIDDADCGSGTTCQAGSCACARTPLRPLELGGARRNDGVLAFGQTADGSGTLDLPPGRYDAIFAHGPHSTIDRTEIQVVGGATVRSQGTVIRNVDTIGWSATDYHVHQEPSLDSAVLIDDRITSFLAEDVDFLSSSDHDILTRFAQRIEERGYADRLPSQIGVEVSTQDIGHFIAWPLRYQEWDDGVRVDGNGAPDWRGLSPGEIIETLRALRSPGDPEVVVEVPHPNSYFDFYQVDPVTLEPSDSIFAILNPKLRAADFSGDFDAMEAINSKSADLIRRPTVGELRFYSQGLDALIERRDRGDIDPETFRREAYSLSTEWARRILHRTVEEQVASLAGDGGDVECLCASDGDCATGLTCDPVLLECVRMPSMGGTPLGDDAMCKRLRGVVDDWFNMLNRGVFRTMLTGSDTHDLYGNEAGMPRTMILNRGSTGAALTSNVVAEAILDGEAVVSMGPMIHFEIDGQPIGSTVRPAGGSVTLDVRVETPGWFDVDRVEVYRNGELIHWATGCSSTRAEVTEDPHGHPCVESGEGVVVAWDETIVDTPDSDAWYVVIALGLDGRTLAPVYSSHTLARFGVFEVAQKVFDLVPTLSPFRTPRFGSLHPTFPVAITNPIWVDVDGGGFTPSLPPPSWCRPGDAGC